MEGSLIWCSSTSTLHQSMHLMDFDFQWKPIWFTVRDIQPLLNIFLFVHFNPFLSLLLSRTQIPCKLNVLLISFVLEPEHEYWLFYLYRFATRVSMQEMQSPRLLQLLGMSWNCRMNLPPAELVVFSGLFSCYYILRLLSRMFFCVFLCLR